MKILSAGSRVRWWGDVSAHKHCLWEHELINIDLPEKEFYSFHLKRLKMSVPLDLTIPFWETTPGNTIRIMNMFV